MVATVVLREHRDLRNQLARHYGCLFELLIYLIRKRISEKKNEKSSRTASRAWDHRRFLTRSRCRCLERKRVVVDYRVHCAISSFVSQESHWHSTWRIMPARSVASLSCCHRFGRLPNVYLSRIASKRKRPVFPLKSKPLRSNSDKFHDSFMIYSIDFKLFM